jgi:hypothetical protein
LIPLSSQVIEQIEFSEGTAFFLCSSVGVSPEFLMSFTDFGSGSTGYEGQSRIRPQSQSNLGRAPENLDRALAEVGDLLARFQVNLAIILRSQAANAFREAVIPRN